MENDTMELEQLFATIDELLQSGDVMHGVPFGTPPRLTVPPSDLVARPSAGTRCRIAALPLMASPRQTALEYSIRTPYLITPRLWEGQCMLQVPLTPEEERRTPICLRPDRALPVIDLPSQSPLARYEVGEQPPELEDLLVPVGRDQPVRLVPALDPLARISTRHELAEALFAENYPAAEKLSLDRVMPEDLENLTRFLARTRPQNGVEEGLWHDIENVLDHLVGPSEGPPRPDGEPEICLRERYRSPEDGSSRWPGLDFLALCRYMPTGRAIYMVNRNHHAALLATLRRQHPAPPPFELCWRGVVSPAGMARLLRDRGGDRLPPLPDSDRDRALLFRDCRARIYPLLCQQILDGSCPALDRGDRVDSFLRQDGSLVNPIAGRLRPSIARSATETLVTDLLARGVAHQDTPCPEAVSGESEILLRVLASRTVVLLDARCTGNTGALRKLAGPLAAAALGPDLRMSDGRSTYEWMSEASLELMRASIRDETRLPLVMLMHGERWTFDALGIALRGLVQPLASASRTPVRLLVVCDLAVPTPTLAWLAGRPGVQRVTLAMPMSRRSAYPKLPRLVETASRGAWRELGEHVLKNLPSSSSSGLPILVQPGGLPEEELLRDSWPRRLYGELTVAPDRLVITPSGSAEAMYERMKNRL